MSRVKNPFYTGAQSVILPIEQQFEGGGKFCTSTRESAIEAAKSLLRLKPDYQEVPVVQIIAIVRRGEMPIVVEEV